LEDSLKSEPAALRAARWLALASAVSVVFSIAASQILLTLALATLLLSGAPLRLPPPIRLPLALFVAGTVLSLALSDDPAAGYPQIRKFYVWVILLVVFSCFDTAVWARRMYLGWAGAAAIASLRAFVQFRQNAGDTHVLTYGHYIGQRITGFMSHWMTFSAELMYVIVGLTALLLFSPAGRRRAWIWWGCLGLAAVALALSLTRSVAFVATPLAVAYLLWSWKPKAVLAVPLVAALAFLASPAILKQRFTSMYEPRREDSNAFRFVVWKTGVRMIEQHPWFGLGPERIFPHFDEYVAPSTPRPLPVGFYGHLHSIYIQFAAERGIPTMLALMWLLARALADMWRGTRRLGLGRSDVEFALQAAVAVILATLAEGIFEHNLGDSEVLTMFLASVGCGYAALEETRDVRKAAGAPCA
jgi:putative inorganic carbon (hco3(-)) transporter